MQDITFQGREALEPRNFNNRHSKPFTRELRTDWKRQSQRSRHFRLPMRNLVLVPCRQLKVRPRPKDRYRWNPHHGCYIVLACPHSCQLFHLLIVVKALLSGIWHLQHSFAEYSEYVLRLEAPGPGPECNCRGTPVNLLHDIVSEPTVVDC